jgi:hypothetical protein
MLPRSPRISSPSFHRPIGFDVLALLVLGFAAPFVIPRVGGGVLIVFLGLAVATMRRRRTMGAYEDTGGLVVRNYLRTRTVPWADAATVKVIRDPILPWLKVAAVVRNDGGTLPVTALRHVGEPTQDVMSLTRAVREGREGLSREVW